MNRTYFKRLSSLALALTVLLSLSVPAAAEEEKALTRTESAAQAAQNAVLYGGADSIQYALWEDGKVTLSGHDGVYSKTENRLLLDTDLYGIGSVSKVYTAAAVMKLVQAGKVSLDAPVTRYLPDFHMADPRYKDITVRMLLNHSSGLMGSSTAGAFLFGDADRSATEDLLKRLSTQRLKADPGAYSVYCNDGFTLAELVVEAVSGMDFPSYVHAALLAPGGLKNTFTPQDDFDTARLTKTYLHQDNRALAQDCLGIVGTGGLYASASDLASFGGLLTGDKLLSAASRKAMAAPEYEQGLWPREGEDAISYGLGWDCVEWFPFSQNGIQALVKGGDTLRYHAGLVVLPEYHMAAAVISSGGVSVYNELAATRMLVDALKEKGVTVDESIPALPPAKPAAMPQELLGKAGYYNSSMGQMEVTLSAAGVLQLSSLTVPSAPVQSFAYHSDGSFRDAAGTALLKLVTEQNGQTYLYQQTYSAIPDLGTLPTASYAAVRVEKNTVDPKTQALWTDAAANCCLVMNETYSAQTWLTGLAALEGEAPRSIPGYLGAWRIVDEAHARYELQLPGLGGRDGQDVSLENRGGTLYFQANGIVLGHRSLLRPLSGRSGVRATIQADGYARWYTIGANTAGLTLTVDRPEESGFTVYDAKGDPTASSAAWGDTSALLPEGGYIVFVGQPGASFQLTYSKAAN